jgi:hypothetical protein
MTLGCARPARPVVKPAPTRPTPIDPAADQAHQELQDAVSGHTLDCPTTPTSRTRVLTSARFLHWLDDASGSSISQNLANRLDDRV